MSKVKNSDPIRRFDARKARLRRPEESPRDWLNRLSALSRARGERRARDPIPPIVDIDTRGSVEDTRESRRLMGIRRRERVTSGQKKRPVLDERQFRSQARAVVAARKAKAALEARRVEWDAKAKPAHVTAAQWDVRRRIEVEEEGQVAIAASLGVSQSKVSKEYKKSRT